MNINEFIENISLGELSNLYIGLEGQVELHPNNRRKLLAYVNQGLKALCSRFQLRKRELIVVGMDHVSLYHLRKEHSMSCGTSKLKYIDDRHCDPFNNDLVKILEVRNEVGMAFPINDLGDSASVFTPSFDTLQLTHAVSGQGYFIIYQALHPVLELEDGGCQDFNLPPLLEEALMAFVAGKAYTHMNGEANKATGAGHMANFENLCLQATAGDLTAESSVTSHSKAQQKGFV